MILATNIREAVRSLATAKQRTILALIGIVIGIGSVIAMVSIGKIVQEEALRQFKEMGTDMVVILRDGGGSGNPKEAIFQAKDAQTLPGACPSILRIAPVVMHGFDLVHGGKKVFSATVLGVTETFPAVNRLSLLKGRFISDLDENSGFCVLGSGAYDKLRMNFKGDGIGESIRSNDKIFTVVGVLKPAAPSSLRPFDPNDAIYLPMGTVMRLKHSPEVSMAIARVRPELSHKIVEKEVLAYFTNHTAVSGMKVQSPEEVIAQMEKQMRMFTLLLGAIGSISLIVGGVGVMNVMLVSVMERRKEIGIRRALGARQGDIRGQFLIESLILSLVGGVLGIVLGVGGSLVAAKIAKWHFFVSYAAIAAGFGVSSVVGVFFGFYPARQASRMDPIVALRS